MADERQHPHDSMVGAVLRDPAEATSFLQHYLPQTLSQALNWSTLRLCEGTFVDDDLFRSKSDFLYEVTHVSGEHSIWLYILLEHQSTPDRLMRFRMLKYCCRIWDMNLLETPTPSELRPIVPLVFYQGERSWTYSREFSGLFAESVRDWPWIPRFSHELIDQTGTQPEEVQGELKVRLMQLLLLAAYHPERSWTAQVVELLRTLSSLPASGGLNYIRIFLRYLLQTQDREIIESFRETLRDQAPTIGDDLMTYAQELLAEGKAEGREEGRLEERVKMIENLLRLHTAWTMIEEVTGVTEAQYLVLKQQLEQRPEA